MNQISKFRLWLLRAVYALLAFGMGSIVWPQIITGSGDWTLMPSVVKSMLGAMTLLALLGIAHPIRMLPLLFWEICWKSIWLVVVAFPAWKSGAMDSDIMQTAIEASLVILVMAAIPWRFVFHHYFTLSANKAVISTET
ncbi:MAG: hypothetical protein HC843_13020 [Sphingomonadales bacterium]|nr:hypothetical protein [Sphingomonadales bacterium]